MSCRIFGRSVLGLAVTLAAMAPVRVAASVIIERVKEESAAARAGLKPGDVLVGWKRTGPNPARRHVPSRGTFTSPFDALDFRVEQVPRGGASLLVKSRGAVVREIPMDSTWGWRAHMLRPSLSSTELTTYRAAIEAEEEDPARAAELYHQLGSARGASGDHLTACWLLYRAAHALNHGEKLDPALAVFDEAIVEAKKAGRPAIEARLWCDKEVIEHQGKGDQVRAVADYRQALAIKERYFPGSLKLAETLQELGRLLYDGGDPTSADPLLKRALLIWQETLPGSKEVADSLRYLGNVSWTRGDLDGAEALYRQSLAIAEGLPQGVERGTMNASALVNLGNVANDRGDFATAEERWQRALALFREFAPGRMGEAFCLGNLAGAARERGDLAQSEALQKKSLALLEKFVPKGPDVATCLYELGKLASQRGDLAGAEDFFLKQLALAEEFGPDGLQVASGLDALADVATKRGDRAKAEEFSKRSIAIRERLAPGTQDLAATLHRLGLIERDSSRPAEAAASFGRALQALEAQKGKLGGGQDVRAGFAEKYRSIYADDVDLLIALGQPEEAFHVLERSRARGMLALLAERDLVLPDAVSPTLAGRQKEVNADYDRTQAALAELSLAKDRTEVDRLLARLRDLGAKREAIATEIRKSSPHFAALKYPQPVDLAGAEAALDPGTALLSYSMGKDRTLLFAVAAAKTGAGASRLEVFPIAIGAEELRSLVGDFRDLALAEPGPGSVKELVLAGGKLYDILVKPAEAMIAASARVVVVPDGPLQVLPFAALVRAGGESRPQYLVEWKPVHTVASATVYTELKRGRRASEATAAPALLAAFGDPLYPRRDASAGPATATDPVVRSALERGTKLAALPGSRREVEDIARIYPERPAIYLGAEATEERAKSLGKEPRLIHFACHAVVNESFPLDSALALSIREKPAPGQENGLLQAWEILEGVRIDADLVTLSACETGLGKDLGGEGLLGLTRAFQYAGARSVLASLWRVEDQATGELMKRFYTELRLGRTKDEALRAAQLQLIGSAAEPGALADLSHPRQWAAFELIGDWK